METTELKVGDWVKMIHRPHRGVGQIVAWWSKLEHPISVKMKGHDGGDVIMSFCASGLEKISEEEAVLWKLQN